MDEFVGMLERATEPIPDDVLERVLAASLQSDRGADLETSSTSVSLSAPVAPYRRRRRQLAMGLIATVVVVAVGAYMVVRRTSPNPPTAVVSDVDSSDLTSSSVSSGSTAVATSVSPASEPVATTEAPTSTSTDTSWLDAFGEETPSPPVSDGWQVLDLGAVRFAVPGDWIVPMYGPCGGLKPGGVVLLDFLEPGGSCSPADILPDSQVVVTQPDGARPATEPDLRVGSLQAWSLDGTATAFRLINGLEFRLTGPDSTGIAATFTDSSARRALQTGPIASTEGWQTVTFGGVSMLVPPTWQIVDLADQDPQHGVFPNPGTCGDALFYAAIPRAFVDNSEYIVSCIVVEEWPIQPSEGIWIRPLPTGDTPDDIVLQGAINGLDVSIAHRDTPTNATISPVLDLYLHHGDSAERLSIGVGTDASIARAIIRSIRIVP